MLKPPAIDTNSRGVNSGWFEHQPTVKVSIVKLHWCIRKRRSYVNGVQSRGRKEREQNIDLFSHVCEKKENDHSILQPQTKPIPDAAVISTGLFKTSLIFYGISLRENVMAYSSWNCWVAIFLLASCNQYLFGKTSFESVDITPHLTNLADFGIENHIFTQPPYASNHVKSLGYQSHQFAGFDKLGRLFCLDTHPITQPPLSATAEWCGTRRRWSRKATASWASPRRWRRRTPSRWWTGSGWGRAR